MKSHNTVTNSTVTRQEVEKFVVRLPLGMRARIAEVARLSHRSMNSEIVARLEDSLENITALSGQPEAPVETPALRAVGQESVQEQKLLGHFRRLSAEKRAALLELLGQ